LIKLKYDGKLDKSSWIVSYKLQRSNLGIQKKQKGSSLGFSEAAKAAH